YANSTASHRRGASTKCFQQSFDLSNFRPSRNCDSLKIVDEVFTPDAPLNNRKNIVIRRRITIFLRLFKGASGVNTSSTILSESQLRDGRKLDKSKDCWKHLVLAPRR